MRTNPLRRSCLSLVALASLIYTGAATAQTVMTLAGTGATGAGNGQGSLATFNAPLGVAVDASGNVYIADFGNQLIRKLTPDGNVSTLAGTAGVRGTGYGQGTGASFTDPFAIAVDSSGNVFVADRGDGTVRKITPGGYVSPFATGLGVPYGIAVDSSNNVYVTDNGTKEILKFSPSGGTRMTFFGGLVAPIGAAVDVYGNVYVEDHGVIKKITPGGVATALAGSGTAGFANGFGAGASFNDVYLLAVDAAGNVYVADNNNHIIRKVSPLGSSSYVTTFAGSGVAGSADGIATAALFNSPTGVAVDKSGNVYVADSSSNKILKILPALTETGSTLTLVGGRFSVTMNWLSYAPGASFVPATAWQINDNYGYFATSDPTSPDVLVKMINFCGANNSWSVYISGATDVGTNINILDTTTGHTYTTSNSLGHPFNLVRDQAFACP
jgi:sugar lactone lactonase YvrE